MPYSAVEFAGLDADLINQRLADEITAEEFKTDREALYAAANLSIEKLALDASEIAYTVKPHLLFGERAVVASATTVDLGALSSHVVEITGTIGIESLGASADTKTPVYVLRFTGALTIVHNSASLITPTGANIETTNGYMAWAEYLGDENWRITPFAGAAGAPGAPGATILAGAGAPSGGDGNNGDYYVRTTNGDFYGPKTAGAWGDPIFSLLGEDGDDGREVQLQTSGGYLQWRYEGESEWTNLFDLALLEGEDGVDGVNPEFQTSATHIQWRLEGESSWTNLVALDDITGPPGSSDKVDKNTVGPYSDGRWLTINPPVDTDNPPFFWNASETVNEGNAGRPNFVVNFGHNLGAGGGPVESGKGAFGMGFEGHYEPNSDEAYFEWHLYFVDPATGLQHRPDSMRLDKVMANGWARLMQHSLLTYTLPGGSVPYMQAGKNGYAWLAKRDGSENPIEGWVLQMDPAADDPDLVFFNPFGPGISGLDMRGWKKIQFPHGLNYGDPLFGETDDGHYFFFNDAVGQGVLGPLFGAFHIAHQADVNIGHYGGDSKLLHLNAATSRVGVGTDAPEYKLDVNGPFGFTPGSSVTPEQNGDIVFEATANDSFTVKHKGSDGTVRSVALPLGPSVVNLAKSADVQIFASSGTWTKPPGTIKAVRAYTLGAGAGGTSGARGDSSAVRPGGGGGGGGAWNEAVFNPADLGSTETVTVGAGGAGGAAASTDGDGVSGAAGGYSAFGAHLVARGGNFGGPAAGGAGFTHTGGQGGAGIRTGGAGATAVGGSGIAANMALGGAGGGSGGGLTITAQAEAGGGAGATQNWRATSVPVGAGGTGGGGAGGAVGTAGTAGSNPADWTPGTGGGGGGSAVAGGAAGANGGRGAGGGGGGASGTGVASGAGGGGGDGLVVVISEY